MSTSTSVETGIDEVPSSIESPQTNEDTATNENETDSDVFYFESDHLALKNNPEYRAVLRTLALLEAQRIQAVQDVDVLISSEKKALEDPIGFVRKLQLNKDLGLPKPQRVANLPNINWKEYALNECVEEFQPKHMTRNKSVGSLEKIFNAANEPIPEFSIKTEPGVGVRGRIPKGVKPSTSQTFNQLWTVEEQKLLEQLLIEYPPEAVEAKRWQKIANHFKNRTPQQVQSRTQKYFIKLAKAGLPVPGRIPNLGVHGRRYNSHRHHRNNRFYFGSSTFMASYEPPVWMDNDDQNIPSASSSLDGDISTRRTNFNADIVSDDEDVPMELRDSPEYLELLKMKKLRKKHIQKEGLAQHSGFKCDSCDIAPIVGTRWHCLDCPPDVSVDFCSSCYSSPLESGHHKSTHRLDKVELSNTEGRHEHIDRDYMRFMPNDYNYLDTNYMPAS